MGRETSSRAWMVLEYIGQAKALVKLPEVFREQGMISFPRLVKEECGARG